MPFGVISTSCARALASLPRKSPRQCERQFSGQKTGHRSRRRRRLAKMR